MLGRLHADGQGEMNSMKAAIEQTAESQAALEAEIREKDADAQALEVLKFRKLAKL